MGALEIQWSGPMRYPRRTWRDPSPATQTFVDVRIDQPLRLGSLEPEQRSINEQTVI